jgi:hypothetical protein
MLTILLVTTGCAKAAKEADHDAALYRMYHKAAEEIERKGGRVLRVQLDYELKEKLYRKLGQAQGRGEQQIHGMKEAFARQLHLPVVNGKVSFPDLRIEYETEDGRHESRDVELVTEHYSRAQLAGKAQAGFSLYRAAGTGRLGAGGARPGGTPVDPHHLEWLG